MSIQDKDLETILGHAIAEIRDETVDPKVIAQAAGRVWNKVIEEIPRDEANPTITSGDRVEPLRVAYAQAEVPVVVVRPTLRGCADFQGLMPEYVQKQSSMSVASPNQKRDLDSRFLLLEDHLHRCVDCRRALQSTRSEPTQAVLFPKRRRRSAYSWIGSRWAWGVAAAFLIAFGLAQVELVRNLWGTKGPLGTVEQADGELYRLSGGEVQVLASNAVLQEGEVVRTSRAAGALIRLADGSLVEMSPRSELSLSKKWSGTTIRLGRGNVIVQAAQQRLGHLQVSTPDCLVSVKGTVFAVNQGMKGSRVSVVQGQVQVDQGRQRTTLGPGQQLTTNPNLNSTSIDAEIAWSRDVSRYSELLRELRGVKEQLEHAGLTPGLRYSSQLVKLVPAETVIFAAVPNFSKALGEGHRLLEERIQQNEALHEWRDEIMQACQGRPAFEEIIAKIRDFGGLLGDEVVLAVPMEASGRYQDLLLLAEVARTDGFEATLRTEVEKLNRQAKGRPVLRVVDSPDAFSKSGDNGSGRLLFLYYSNGILGVSPGVSALQTLAAAIKNPANHPFAGTDFYARLSESYREGAGWLFGLDMQRLVSRPSRKHLKAEEYGKTLETMDRAGILNVKHLIIEHKENQGKIENVAALSFEEPRRGMTSWLGEPGPMGSLAFVSPDANLLAAFVVKNPASLLEDLLGVLEGQDPSIRQHLDEFQAKQGVNVRDDLAAPLGGEFAIALDGPVLPKPSWKVVLEVNDPARLQRTIEWAVQQFNREGQSHGKPSMQLNQIQAGGRIYYRIGGQQPGLEFEYCFVDGYLVAAPSRVLVEQSIQFRNTGYILPRSDTFSKLLPRDGRANFSAVLYQNLSPLLKPVAGIMGDIASSLTAEQRKTLETVASNTPPTLICAYAEEKRIVVASSGDLSYLGLSLGSLMHLNPVLGRNGKRY